MKALFIDDEPFYVDAYMEVLKSLGYEVDSAITVNQAKNKIEDKSYDLFILDIMMPGNGDGEFEIDWRKAGIQLFDYMLNEKNIKKPVIFFSVVSDDENAREINQIAKQADFTWYENLVKPVELSTFRKQVLNLKSRAR